MGWILLCFRAYIGLGVASAAFNVVGVGVAFSLCHLPCRGSGPRRRGNPRTRHKQGRKVYLDVNADGSSEFFDPMLDSGTDADGGSITLYNHRSLFSQWRKIWI